MSFLEDKRNQMIQCLRENLNQHGLYQLNVADVMTHRPTCIEVGSTAYDLIQMFHARGFRHLLVVDDRKLVGVVSDRDALRCYSVDDAPTGQYLRSIQVQQLMSTDLVTVTEETPVGQAVELLIDQGISCLPVVSGRAPVGILTSTDLYLLLEQLLKLPLTAQPAVAE